MPKVSIVLPVYNEEEHIQASLRSIIAQDKCFDAEIIVVDSASTDRTVILASQYPVGLVQAPKGKLKARAVGIQWASGDIVVAADGDSVYHKDWLSNLVRHFDDPAVVAVSGPRLYFDTPVLNIGLYFRYFVMPRPNMMVGSNSAFRRKVFYQIGGFRDTDEFTAEIIQQEEEYAFGERLAAVGNYVYDREAICYTSSRRWCTDCKHKLEGMRGERF